MSIFQDHKARAMALGKLFLSASCKQRFPPCHKTKEVQEFWHLVLLKKLISHRALEKAAGNFRCVFEKGSVNDQVQNI